MNNLRRLLKICGNSQTDWGGVNNVQYFSPANSIRSYLSRLPVSSVLKQRLKVLQNQICDNL